MNYCSFIVKIETEPLQRYVKENIRVTEILVTFPQTRSQTLIKNVQVFIWSNVDEEITKYLKKNDYIIIEGYIYLQRNIYQTALYSRNNLVQISARKIYPFA